MGSAAAQARARLWSRRRSAPLRDPDVARLSILDAAIALLLGLVETLLYEPYR
jgi:hypothetical protein